MLRNILFAAGVQSKGDTFIKLPDAVDASLTSRFSAITVYKHDGTSFVVTGSQPVTGTTLYGCVFSPDGVYLVLVHSGGLYLFKQDAGASKYSNYQNVFDSSNCRSLAMDPSGVYVVLAYGVAYSDTGNYVAVVGDFTGYI